MKSLSVRLGVILIGLFIFIYTETLGKDGSGRITLWGIKGVYVLVERLKPDLEKDGLTEDQLLTDVELQLRKVGIRVLTKGELYKVPGSPCLYVNINAYKGKVSQFFWYCLNIKVSLNQDVLLERKLSITESCSTWERSTLGGCGKSSIKEYVREGLKEIIDEFINDYLTANPK